MVSRRSRDKSVPSNPDFRWRNAALNQKVKTGHSAIVAMSSKIGGVFKKVRKQKNA
jgi:hypothetical protein